MQINVNKTIILWKLGKELALVDIANNGMSLYDNVLEIKLVNEIQTVQAQAVVDSHNGSTDTIIERRDAARTIAKNIPDWATWSKQDWETWQAANVSSTQINAVASLADAKVILNKMSVVLNNLAKMEIALRDQIWPDIPDNN